MTISQTQLVDILYKKLSGVSKTDTSAAKSPANEANASPQLSPGSTIWQQDYLIPTVNTLPTSNSSVVTVYRQSLSSTIQSVALSESVGQETWTTGLTNWIPPQFGAGYQLKLYAGPPGSSTPENFINLPVGGSGNSDSWYFDYSAGIVNFADTNVPTAAANVANVVYAEGARYTGLTGIATLGNVNIGSISINGNTISGNTGISIVGNVTSAGYFYANGTNIVTAIQTYSNANVTSYLPTYSGNLNPSSITTPATYTGVLHVDTIYSNTANVITFGISTAIGLPVGGNIARPGSPQSGQIRFNSDLDALEFYTGVNWQSLNNTVSGQDFYGDGVNATYTLNNTSTTSGILVSINGTVQQPGTAYSVLGNQITFAEVPQSTDLIDIRFLGTATTSINNLVTINPTAIPVITANTIIDSFDQSVVRSVHYTISSTASVDAHMAEINLVQFNGTTVLNVTSNINTNGNTITYYANVNGSTVNLLAQGTTSSNVRVQRTYFSV